MGYLLKRWRLLVLGLITSISVTLLASTTAFAAQPGESNSWTNEVENNQNVQSDGDMVEARDPRSGDLLQVWRGWNNNALYMSVNHSVPYQIGGATTYVTPAVEWSHTEANGESIFRVFHTGTNGFIFYSNVRILASNGHPVAEGGWIQVPNNAQTINSRSVAVTALPNDGLYLVYRGASSNEIWGMFYSGGTRQWDLPTRVTGATSDSSPAVSYSLNTQIIVVAWRGTDNEVNVIRQTYGESYWWGHDVLSGIATDAQPAVAMTDNSRGQVAVRVPGTGRLALADIWATGGWDGRWGAEVNSFVARYGPALVAYATTVYLLATAGNGYVYWKQSRQF